MSSVSAAEENELERSVRLICLAADAAERLGRDVKMAPETARRIAKALDVLNALAASRAPADAVHVPQGPTTGLNAIIGQWPADESDEAIGKALSPRAPADDRRDDLRMAWTVGACFGKEHPSWSADDYRGRSLSMTANDCLALDETGTESRVPADEPE